MKIAVIGSRRVGTGLGAMWAEQGHAVVAGNCKGHARLAPVLPHDADVECGTPSEATSDAQVVFLAASPAHLPGYLAAIGQLAGKVVIDAYDQYERAPDGSLMGDYLARVLPEASIVKAFDTVRWYFQPPLGADGPLGPSVVPMSGENPAAKALVTTLIADIGLTAADLGARADSRPRPAVHLAAVTA